MWAHLRRQGIPPARCTVERWYGVHGPRTTMRDPKAAVAPDLVNWDFRRERPDELHVADFTSVRLAAGLASTAFVIDAFAGTIVGWACSLRHDTRLVERALRMAEGRRAREGHPRTGRTIHHSDAGSAYTALHCGASLLQAGMVASIGSVGDAYDNALAETTIGRDTTECLRPGSPCARGPLASLTDLEEVTSAWVHCYDTRRLLHHFGRRPPVEVVQGTLAAERPSPRPFTRNEVCTEPGVVHWDL